MIFFPKFLDQKDSNNFPPLCWWQCMVSAEGSKLSFMVVVFVSVVFGLSSIVMNFTLVLHVL